MGRIGQVRKGYYQRMKDKRIEELQRALQESAATVEELEDVRDRLRGTIKSKDSLIDRSVEHLGKAAIRITAMQSALQRCKPRRRRKKRLTRTISSVSVLSASWRALW